MLVTSQIMLVCFFTGDFFEAVSCSVRRCSEVEFGHGRETVWPYSVKRRRGIGVFSLDVAKDFLVIE